MPINVNVDEYSSTVAVTSGADEIVSVEIDNIEEPVNVDVNAGFVPHTHYYSDLVGLGEDIQDVIGGMIESNTEAGLSVTYDDTTGKINFNVNDPTITLSGDVTGSGTITNLGNVTITATVADDSHNHIISNIDGLQTSLDGKQPLDGDLTAIAGITGTSGFLKKTAADTWSLDTNTYLTGNQSITLTGDVSGSGTTSINVTIADDSHNHIISNVDGLQTALDAKAPLASPVLTGTPTAPTATAGTNTTQIATTAFVQAATAALVDSAPTTLDTLNELAAALGDDPNFATTISTQIGLKLDASEYTALDVLNKIKTLDGTGSGLDADLLDGQHGSYYAPIASPTFSGTPSAPTATSGTNTTQIATTAFVQTAVSDLTDNQTITLTQVDTAVTNQEKQNVEFRQFSSAGSVLNNLPSRVHPAEQLLKQAVWWIDSAHSSASDQTIKNLGWGGSVLDAQCGSTSGLDTNDPKYLDWSGENYVYLPGVNGNYLSVPNEAALQITGDLDLRGQIRPATWTPGGGVLVVAKLGSNGRYSYWFSLLSNGKLRISTSPNGTTIVTNTSTVATGFSNNEVKWVRATLDLDDGAGNRVAKFYTSDDGVSWTQLGDTVTTAGTASIYVETALVEIGSYWQGTAGTSPCAHYRAIVKDGIDGPSVLDIDCSQISSGGATSFRALTGQTVTINRSTSGRKTVAVTQPCWLFGTDDYLSVADSDLLDFGASDSFTVFAAVRQWDVTPPSASGIIAKRGGATAYWSLVQQISGSLANFVTTDSVNSVTSTASGMTDGTLSTIVAALNRTAATSSGYVNATQSSSVSASAVGSLANDNAMTVGRYWGSGSWRYADMEGIAFAVFRRALTSDEIKILNDYFQGRGI